MDNVLKLQVDNIKRYSGSVYNVLFRLCMQDSLPMGSLFFLHCTSLFFLFLFLLFFGNDHFFCYMKMSKPNTLHK